MKATQTEFSGHSSSNSHPVARQYPEGESVSQTSPDGQSLDVSQLSPMEAVHPARAVGMSKAKNGMFFMETSNHAGAIFRQGPAADVNQKMPVSASVGKEMRICVERRGSRRMRARPEA